MPNHRRQPAHPNRAATDDSKHRGRDGCRAHRVSPPSDLQRSLLDRILSAPQRYNLLAPNRKSRKRPADRHRAAGPPIPDSPCTDNRAPTQSLSPSSSGVHPRQQAHPVPLGEKSTLQMGVAKKCQRQFELCKMRQRLAHVSHVFVFIRHSSHDTSESVLFSPAPSAGRANNRMSLVSMWSIVHRAAACATSLNHSRSLNARHHFVMIAANHRRAILLHPARHSARAAGYNPLSRRSTRSARSGLRHL